MGGLEPSTPCMSSKYSNQLSYTLKVYLSISYLFENSKINFNLKNITKFSILFLTSECGYVIMTILYLEFFGEDIMKPQYLANESEMLSNNDERIELPTIISHAVGNAMAEVVPALSSVLRLANLPLPVHNFVARAEMVARDLSAKTAALVELFSETDSVSRPKMISLEIVQFFEALTSHLNETLADKTSGSIEFVLADDSERGIILDSKRVATILYHLVANSLQHGRTKNKNIKLICKVTTDYFEMIVRDYGGGVPKEIQPVLFTKFLEEFNIKQAMVAGLPPRICGLGLPLCRRLAHDMDGELLFRNYRSGAQFTLRVPQNSHAMQEPTIYYPDDALLQSCMTSLWLYLEEQKEKEKKH